VARLRGKHKRALGSQPTGEFCQDGQIDVQTHALDPTHAQRSHRPFVLEPAELALDGSTAAVELA
jgi:hypothetical protein